MSESEDAVSTAFVNEAAHRFDQALKKIHHCLRQLDEGQIWWRPHEALNSIANLLLHLCGNVRQWMIAGVGGETDVRDRPREFSERGPIPTATLLRDLDEVVRSAIDVLHQGTAASLLEKRRIQGFDTTVLAAVLAAVAHFEGHVQEIVSLTRQQLGHDYEFDFVPQSKEQGA